MLPPTEQSSFHHLLLLLLLWSQVLTEQLFFGRTVFVKQMSLIDTFGSDDDLMDDLDSQMPHDFPLELLGTDF